MPEPDRLSVSDHDQGRLPYRLQAGLRGIVALRNTVPCPAVGGCRIRLFDGEAESFDDEPAG